MILLSYKGIADLNVLLMANGIHQSSRLLTLGKATILQLYWGKIGFFLRELYFIVEMKSSIIQNSLGKIVILTLTVIFLTGFISV